MKKNETPWKILAKTKNESGAYDVMVYGEVGWDFGAKSFAEDLKKIPKDAEINFHVNSVGGSVWDGIAIYNVMKKMPNKKNVIVEGLAASIASIIALAGDTVHMATGSMIMIHNAWTFAAGTAEELEKQADVLAKVNASLMDIYEKETGMDRSKIEDLMTAETWMDAAEAIEMGFADSMDETLEVAAKLNDGRLVVNGIGFKANALKNLPMNKYTGEEEKVMDIDTLKAEHADLYNEIVEQARAEGAKQERERIQQLDAIKRAGAEEIVNRAKYETFETANEVALEILNSLPETKTKTVTDLTKDAEVLNDVDAGSSVPQNKRTEEERMKGMIMDAVRNHFKK
ncbi:MAG: Clp protease ClpP [Negativicoccus succinicivorans]|uniref:head maturation protease, ClpP-related n=1 Tax=Negativicoccus succinicivorans TaxID=620903 RepID=UPI00290A149E|nr:head maturation protease, ClpP-related [Negativicoccus succinicivorans]MDU5395734.1 Clp protease ClpP [Negativicoccus succinicivorans]